MIDECSDKHLIIFESTYTNIDGYPVLQSNCIDSRYLVKVVKRKNILLLNYSSGNNDQYTFDTDESCSIMFKTMLKAMEYNGK